MFRLVLMSAMMGSIGQIMMKHGSNRLGRLTMSPATFAADLGRVLRVPEFWVAILLFSLSSLIWVKVLSRADLTSAYPLNSMSYIFVFLFSAFFLNEALTLQKVAGALVIMLGIFIITR
ncbi:EamA family transporter [Paenibacillus sp. YN15]|uniref:EamA family transporter n=1 Tax=Paenibacillus sp. YN15 TaxID=1742774 RepID=UPI000DCD4085|nr:EamA family transporter [Paenibacillus sp. YN15]RAU96565.1 transporter [Paenibacillus sp. YN15]